jgi:hypothetical protein
MARVCSLAALLMAATAACASDSLPEPGNSLLPVAGSGADPLAEYAMRVSAQLTLGRYVFLTNDSGYGGGHMAPTIPCYYVTGLDDAILRMVTLEMTGKTTLPNEADVVRTVGDPDEDGVCEVESGDTAQAI